MTLSSSKHSYPKTALGGTMIIVGTSVGAGMLSLPIATAGVWFTGSVFLLLYTGFCMLISGLMIVECNLHYPENTGFSTMCKDLLGKLWNNINTLSLAFVLYILTYAYISAGGSIISNNLTTLFTLPSEISSIVFALCVGIIIWSSTCTVDRITTILVGGMLLSFVLTISNLFHHINSDILLDSTPITEKKYLSYALVSLPYLLASFGFHGNVPGLVTYYKKESKVIVRCLVYASIIAIIFYISWQYVIQGNILRSDFKAIIADGGNVGNLLAHLQKNQLVSPFAYQTITFFSYMALTSSFLGVTLGLLDFIRDYFHLPNNASGRAKAAMIAITPPLVAVLFYPNGFLHAIGFAGFFATLWAVIIPALMVYSARKRFKKADYRVPGGTFMVLLILVFGLSSALIHILEKLNVLSIFT